MLGAELRVDERGICDCEAVAEVRQDRRHEG